MQGNKMAELGPLENQESFYQDLPKKKPFSEKEAKLSIEKKPYSLLSTKIQAHIATSGSAKEWSKAIEAKLLSSIIPDLQSQFPSFRTAKKVLKEIWEKHQKSKKKEERAEELSTLVRNAIQHIPPSPQDLLDAHIKRIAKNIKKLLPLPNRETITLEQLEKLVWAAHKHVLMHPKKPPLSSMEKYTCIDKIIVKTLLEKIVQNPLCKPTELKNELQSLFQVIQEGLYLGKKNYLTPTLSILLARKCGATYLNTTPPEIWTAIQDFINWQVKISRYNQSFSTYDTITELVQRILSSYFLAIHLPKNLDVKKVQQTIRQVLLQKKTCSSPGSPKNTSSLHLFIHAQLNLMNDQKQWNSLSSIEELFLDSYLKTTLLPPPSSLHHEKVDLLIWHFLDNSVPRFSNLDSKLQSFLENELGTRVIDSPHATFRQIIHSTVVFFRELSPFFTQKNSVEEKKAWEEKSDFWIAQHGMGSQSTHFDQTSPVCEYLLDYCSAHSIKPIKELNASTLSTIAISLQTVFPSLAPFQQQLHVRLRTFLCYLWHTNFSNFPESSCERFVKWHLHLSPPANAREKRKLFQIIRKLVPLIPIDFTSFFR